MTRCWYERGEILCMSEKCNFTCPKFKENTCITIKRPKIERVCHICGSDYGYCDHGIRETAE